MKIELGKKYKDPIIGFEGRAVTRTDEVLELGACKLCKYFKVKNSNYNFKFGECERSSKAVFDHDDSLIMKGDECATWHNDYCGRVIVGEDFGCIHFMKNDQSN